MDIQAYIKYLLRFKWLLLLVPLLSVVLTAFLIKDMPQQYRSTAQISTGLTDESKQTVNPGQNMDYFKVSQQFGNLMEMMKMKKVLSALSLKLILHDLEEPSNSFQPYSELLESLGSEKQGEVSGIYRRLLLDGHVLNTADNKKFPLFDLVISMGYDEESLLENLEINRSGESDFINVSYSSENPELSAFVVNNLSSDFIAYYLRNTSMNQKTSMVVLDSVLKAKEMVMNQRNADLKEYKIGSGVLNLDKQSDVIYQQIAEYEAKKAQAINQMQSVKGALDDINRKLSGKDADYSLSQDVETNSELVNLENQLQEANKRYIDHNFRQEDKRMIDSLSKVRTAKIARISDGAMGNPTLLKQQLIDQKLKLETDLSLAKNGMASLESELKGLRAKYRTLVPTDASVQNLERDADVATKEYMEALNNYNQASLQSSTGLRLSINQMGLLGTPEPSKKMIYTAMSGASGFFVCLIVLTILFLLDKAIRNKEQLENIAGACVLGELNMIEENNKDLRDIWDDDHGIKSYETYKDLLRSLRFELSRFLNDQDKVLAITSLDEGDGKTFLASSLAYAFAMTGKKVLLICENAPGLAEILQNRPGKISPQKFEAFLVKKEIQVADLITILNRNPANNSLLEMRDPQSLFSGFEILKQTFDLIIMDIDTLKQANRVKEWLLFADKSLAIFRNGKAITQKERELMVNLAKQKGFIGWIFNHLGNKSAA